MSDKAIQDYIKATHECLAKASQMFNVNLHPGNVTIQVNIRGTVAGWARNARNGVYRLRFNPEAIINYPEQMADTIPHEVAHLVCYANPRLGSGHDAGWKRVCRMLGGDDSRTHDMVLTKVREKERVRYIYNVLGVACTVGPRQHQNIQTGKRGYSFNHPKHGRVAITPYMWEDKNTKVKKAGANEWSETAGAVQSKRAIAWNIYLRNLGLSRKDMITKFVAEANMTPAGAATYYQTFKSKQK